MLLVSITGCASSPDAAQQAVRSRFETDPAGASLFVDGTFVGTTPCETTLPASDRVTVRLELPGYQSEEEILRRRGQPKDAPAGAGWEELYLWPLTRE